VYVAAMGHLWGPNKERGLFRTTDGGRTWQNILFRSDKAGAFDISFDPANPNVIFAAFWQIQRTPYSLISGGEGSGIYRSGDGGETWTDISKNRGMPAGVLGKIGVSVSPVNPNRVWAMIEAKDGGLYRSDDGGDTWQRTSDKRVDPPAAVVLHACLCRYAKCGHRLCAKCRFSQVDRRRPDVQHHWGPHGDNTICGSLPATTSG
jgi:photosystem II stability/assembly factor-like uncharacterized protein